MTFYVELDPLCLAAHWYGPSVDFFAGAVLVILVALEIAVVKWAFKR